MSQTVPRFDQRWKSQLRRGDEEAVALLANGMLGPLYGFCYYRIGGNHHLCEEVVQETMLRAIDEIAKYDPRRSGGEIFGWITGLARNEIARVLASERMTGVKAQPSRRLSLELLWEQMDEELLRGFAQLDTELLAPDVLVREETRELVRAAMSQLPPNYREALEAKYLGDQSMRQIAGAMGITEKAVEGVLTRARDAFRATFLALTRNIDIQST